MSFFVPKKHITYALDTTYSPKRWKSLAFDFSKKISQISSKTVSGYLDLVGSIQSKTGIDDKETDLTAKASENTENSDIQKNPVWQIPLDGEITSPFGERTHPVTGEKSFHTGLDISAKEGDAVLCASDGTVKETGSDDINGNFAIIEHSPSFSTVYAHLGNICTESGKKVRQGQKIGEAGSTGISTGPHLHFEIKLNGKSVDPTDYISGWIN